MFRIALMVVVFASLLCAGGAESKPIGSVSSRGAVRVTGTTLDIAEVPSWPVVSGDVIQTQSESATVLLNDGTRLVLDAASSVTLAMREPGTLVVTLGAGSLKYNVSKNVSVTLVVGKRERVLEGGASGAVELERGRPARDDRPRNSTQRPSRPVLSPHEP